MDVVEEAKSRIQARDPQGRGQEIRAAIRRLQRRMYQNPESRDYRDELVEELHRMLQERG